VTAPNMEPIFDLLRRFGAEVSRMVRQLITDLRAHLREAEPEVLIERVVFAIVTFAGRAAARLVHARMARRPAAA
jgi:hypothetical protein